MVLVPLGAYAVFLKITNVGRRRVVGLFLTPNDEEQELTCH